MPMAMEMELVSFSGRSLPSGSIRLCSLLVFSVVVSEFNKHEKWVTFCGDLKTGSPVVFGFGGFSGQAKGKPLLLLLSFFLGGRADTCMR